MRGKDLEVGMVVAVTDGTYGKLELGDENLRRGIVLGTDRAWRSVGGFGTNSYQPLGDSGRWGPKGGYPVAVERDEVLTDPETDELYHTDHKVWVPRAFGGRDIVGLWADHLVALAETRRVLTENRARREAASAKARVVNERLEALGLRRMVPENGHLKTTVTTEELAKLLDLAEKGA
jgi:hypothetical protein